MENLKDYTMENERTRTELLLERDRKCVALKKSVESAKTITEAEEILRGRSYDDINDLRMLWGIIPKYQNKNRRPLSTEAFKENIINAILDIRWDYLKPQIPLTEDERLYGCPPIYPPGVYPMGRQN